jgi:hypothetical protein
MDDLRDHPRVVDPPRTGLVSRLEGLDRGPLLVVQPEILLIAHSIIRATARMMVSF